MAHGGSEPQSLWLLHWLDRVLALTLFAFATFAFIDDWPPGRLGNAYQLVGLCFAALAFPVLSPSLAKVEVRMSDLTEASKRWLAERRERLRVWWARVRRKQIDANIRAGSASAAFGAGGVVSVGQVGVDREKLGEREWLRLLNADVEALRNQVRELESGREADRNDVDEKLEALRVELQEHTLAVTREGWDYVFTGAVLTGLGIVLTLV